MIDRRTLAVNSRCGIAAVLVGIAFTAACVGSLEYGDAIEVKGRTKEEKVRRAQSIATTERLQRLATQIKERVPGVTEPQLASMTLGWEELHSIVDRDASTVKVTVGLTYDRSFDPKPIIDAAVAILGPEVNPPEGEASGGKR